MWTPYKSPSSSFAQPPPLSNKGYPCLQNTTRPWEDALAGSAKFHRKRVWASHWVPEPHAFFSCACVAWWFACQLWRLS